MHVRPKLPPSLPFPYIAAKSERTGELEGWGEGEKSVVAMETTGREELGLCAGWGRRGA